ncbi:MAG TPA: BMP family ABC transporter substrate-binding protein [Ilumatobacteraceae bacterium]|nr:BMP family ABC transporter substrate-binding protein [Ilumatobacteraceae bacterium]
MRTSKSFIAAIAALSLIAAACGDDDEESTTTEPSSTEPASTEPSSTEPVSTEPASTEPASTETTSGEAPAALDLDTNGDGTVVFGIAAAGPRDDGGYYQALVDKAIAVSEENGYGEPIVVDNITTEDAATELANLAEQGVDTIFVGASEIADPLTDLIAQYPDIFWYCNCGAGYPENPGLAQSQDDSSEISYSAGYATGLLLQESGGDNVAFIGCCDLNFEKEAYLAYELGLKAVDDSYTMTYVPTGAFPFDFDNTAGATEALNGAITNGADAVYPYLGGAHEPLVSIANGNGLITMSAGSSTACERTDLDYQIQVKFDGGDYIDSILAEIADGTFHEGDVRVFRVGVDPQPGAEICDPTPEQATAMEDLYAQIAAGEFVEAFGAIKGQAYSGG